MTKEINKTIRSLTIALNELEGIEIESELFEYKDDGYYDPNYSDDRFNITKYYIRTLIKHCEEKYQKLHKAGAYNE